MALVTVARLDEFPPGSLKIVTAGSIAVGVYNLGGRLCAIEDRCSHDDGPLCEGDWDEAEGVVICPRHGANFDIRTGDALTLPAFQPVAIYRVDVVDGTVRLELP